MCRFATNLQGHVIRALGPGPKTQLGLAGAKAGNIKGTSTDLEKPYLRLHFAPDPSTIRPPHVLERALALVKKKWTVYVCMYA